MVITGAQGTGKSTLAKILLGEMNESQLCVASVSAAQVGMHGILPAAAAAFGLNAEGLDKNSALKQLELMLLARARERKRALLLVDDAHNLPNTVLAELAALANLKAGDKALLQTFILAQESFKNALNSKELEPIRQKVIANFNLLPIAGDEVQRYVESRLSQVGWQGDPSFAEISFEHIHAFSKGVPRQINLLCDRILLYSAMEERHEITVETVRQVIESISDDGEDAIEKLKQSTRAAQQRLRNQQNVFGDGGVSSKEELTEQLDARQFHQKMNSQAQLTDKTLVLSAAEKQKLAAASNPRNSASNSAANANNAANTSANTGLNSGANAGANNAERDMFRVIDGGRPASTQTAGARANTASAEDVVLRRILRLVLAFHRSPSRFPGMDNPNQPLPEGVTELLELAVSDDEVLNRVSPAAVMGISPVMLRAAVRFFVRRALLVVDADDYRVLGLSSSADQDLIRKHYDLLSQLLKQDKQRGTSDSIKRIADAYKALLKTDSAPAPSITPPVTAPAANQDVDATQQIRREDREDKVIIIDDGLDIDMEIGLGGDSSIGLPHAHSGTSRESDLTDRFSFEDAVSQKRMRYAGQLAVMGLGALVVVVFFYIIQLEPEADSRDATEVSKVIAQAEQDARAAEKRAQEQNMEATFATNVGGNVLDSEESSFTQEQEQSKNDLSSILQEVESESAKRAEAAEKSERIKQMLAGQSVPEASSQNRSTPRMVETPKTTRPIQAASSEPEPVKEVPDEMESGEQLAMAETMAQTKSETIAETKAPPSPEKVVTMQRPLSRSPLRSRNARVVAKPINSSSNASSINPPVSTSSRRFAPPPSTPARAPIPATPKQAEIQIAANKPMPAAPPLGAPRAAMPPQKSGLNTSLLRQFERGFERAYQSGQLDRLMQMFSVNASTNNQESPVAIRRDYADLFKSTRSRKMEFSGIKWKIDGSHARGDGKYTARIMPNGTTRENVYQGKVTLHVDLSNRRLQISKFYFTNDDVKGAQASNISHAELNRFINTFVAAYENGKLNELMGLFAKNARTNDQTSRAGIRKDHEELFSSTRARQMFLKNMNWNYASNSATGQGDFEVLVQPNNSNEFVSYKGRIEIAVEKSGNRMNITRMLHNIK